MTIFYLLAMLCMLFVFYAQYKVQSTFRYYNRVLTRNGITGAQAAAIILKETGLHDVAIEEIGGTLTDHYDPGAKVLRLSAPVAETPSLAAVGVAAHEAGHAIQHASGYFMLRIRAGLLPFAQLGSQFGLLLVVIGFIIHALSLAWLGLILFSGVVLFQVATLPVEYDASARAIRILEKTGILSAEELPAAEEVLDAAALTYLSTTLYSVMMLLHYASLLMGASLDDE